MTSRFTSRAELLIAELRGLPPEGAAGPDAGAKPLGSLLEACIERYHIGRHTPEEAILENWERIVGPEFAGRCRPRRIDPSGALVVQAANATVRRELIFMEDRILTALAAIPGCGHVNRVVHRAGP